MTLKAEVDQIQIDLFDMKTLFDRFEVTSKALIQRDRTAMLLELEKSVISVAGTMRYLNTGESPFTASNQQNNTIISHIWKPDQSRELTSKHLNDMHNNFSRLYAAASLGLERVEHIKKTCEDLHAHLGALRLRLRSISARAKTELDAAQEALSSKNAEATKARSTLDSTQSNLRELEDKMERRKDVRNILRAARIFTWTAGVLFLPTILAAGGLEAIATNLRHKRESLQFAIDVTTRQLQPSLAEVSSMETDIASLEQALSDVNSLMARLEVLEASSSQISTVVEGQLIEYQALKESTDCFAAWTCGLADRAAVMQLIGPSSQIKLRQATEKIVERLLDTEDSDMKLICGKFQSLDRGE